MPALPFCHPRALRGAGSSAVPQQGQTHGHKGHTQPLHDSTAPTTPFGKIFIYNKSVPKRLVTKNELLLQCLGCNNAFGRSK